jgi:hypothetical protein
MSHNISAHASLNDLLKAAGGNELLKASGGSPVKQEERESKKSSPRKQIESKDMPPQVIVTIQTNEISEMQEGTVEPSTHDASSAHVNAGTKNQKEDEDKLKLNHSSQQNHSINHEKHQTNQMLGHYKSSSEQFYNTTGNSTTVTGASTATVNPFQSPSETPFVTSASHPRIHQTQSFPTQNINVPPFMQQQLYHPYTTQIEQGPNMIHRPGSSSLTYSRPQPSLSYDAIDPKRNAKHTKSLSLDTSSLAQIAAELSTLKPMTVPHHSQQKKKLFFKDHNDDEDRNVNNKNDDDDYAHLVTLGDDPKDCTTPMANKRHHRKFLSFQGTMNSNNFNTAAPSATSSRPNSGDGNGSTVLSRPNSGSSTLRPNSGGSLLPRPISTPSPTASVPTTTTINTNDETNTEIKIRSSEQDPTPHQMSIPTLSETLFQAKLCELMDNYRKIDQNFDFSCLIHMPTTQIMECVHHFHSGGPLRSSRTSLNTKTLKGVNSKRASIDTSDGFHRVSSIEKMDALSGRRGSMESVTRVASPENNTSSTTTFDPVGSGGTPLSFINTELFNCNQQQLMVEHEPILSSILECGDLILEGFYYEGVTHMSSDKKSKPFDTSNEKSTQDRMEVAIFKSDTRRQIIVVYQDSDENQSNPVKKREQKDGIQRRFHIGSGKNDNRFSEEQPYPVFPPFRKAYFENGDIESKVFRTLDELSEQNPFYDVIMTGHSMGGVLSLLASMRYADAKPAIMVSCFAFGCPKVGSLDFRFYINSLPNLKVMRFEYGFDPWIYCPDHPMWVHVGHTIMISKCESKTDASGPNHRVLHRTSSDGVVYANSRCLTVKAFKFGAIRPDSSGSVKGVGGGLGKILNRHRERNMDHEISSYVHALEMLQTFDNSDNQGSWPISFVGEDGGGVQGLDHEKRLVC